MQTLMQSHNSPAKDMLVFALDRIVKNADDSPLNFGNFELCHCNAAIRSKNYRHIVAPPVCVWLSHAIDSQENAGK